MIYKRQFRENDPALGILDKAFRFVVVVFGFILDIDGCIAMTDSCGRTEEYRCFYIFQSIQMLPESSHTLPGRKKGRNKGVWKIWKNVLYPARSGKKSVPDHRQRE